MWRRVALSSKESVEQLQAYQNAIEALSVSTIYIEHACLLLILYRIYVPDPSLKIAIIIFQTNVMYNSLLK